MVENEFTDALKALDADGGELHLSPDGAAKLSAGGVEMTFVVPASSPQTVYCRAEVAPLEGLDENALAPTLLEGCFMWQATGGGTLSVRDGRVYLTDRREARFFADADALAGYVESFSETVRLWRERMETFRIPGGKEAK